MATKITEECISCGACEDECPNTAISYAEDPDIFVIDPARCTECVGHDNEQRCAAACPPDVCVPDPAHADTEEVLFDRVKTLWPDRANEFVLDNSTSHFRLNQAG